MTYVAVLTFACACFVGAIVEDDVGLVVAGAIMAAVAAGTAIATRRP